MRKTVVPSNMNIINDYKTNHFNGWYALFIILSFITFRKVKTIEKKKGELSSKVNRLF
ncbi:MAG: hypothetical protein GX072_13145 [Lysinibacillus sp.]|nr:hypothetical protein [Lysinibacillus sp.]